MAAFKQRLLSAAVLIPLVLGAVWAGGTWLGALLLALSGLMAKEWVEICFEGRPEKGPWSARTEPAAVAVVAAVLLATFAASLDLMAEAIVLALVGATLVAGLAGMRRGADDAILAIGVLYLAFPMIALMYLYGGAHGVYDVYWVLAVVWTTDSGAYVAGAMLGGPRLAPVISPNKTWAGLFGGIVATLAVAVAFAGLVGVYDPLLFVLASVLLSLAAQGGDLLESAVKRHFDVKDSGSIIPGHGGVLDRVDGLLVALPLAACARLFMGHGEFIWR